MKYQTKIKFYRKEIGRYLELLEKKDEKEIISNTVLKNISYTLWPIFVNFGIRSTFTSSPTIEEIKVVLVIVDDKLEMFQGLSYRELYHVINPFVKIIRVGSFNRSDFYGAGGLGKKKRYYGSKEDILFVMTVLTFFVLAGVGFLLIITRRNAWEAALGVLLICIIAVAFSRIEFIRARFGESAEFDIGKDKNE